MADTTTRLAIACFAAAAAGALLTVGMIAQLHNCVSARNMDVADEVAAMTQKCPPLRLAVVREAVDPAPVPPIQVIVV